VVCTTTTSFLLIEMGSRKFFYWTDLNLWSSQSCLP
jgi:hypothetical protein